MTERCENCGARIIRNLDQPRRCAQCAPPSAAPAIYRVLGAITAQRSQRVLLELQAAERSLQAAQSVARGLQTVSTCGKGT